MKGWTLDCGLDLPSLGKLAQPSQIDGLVIPHFPFLSAYQLCNFVWRAPTVLCSRRYTLFEGPGSLFPGWGHSHTERSGRSYVPRFS